MTDVRGESTTGNGTELVRHLRLTGATALAITIVVGSGALVLADTRIADHCPRAD